MTSWLHEERLHAVEDAVRATGATRILDLGCGDGDLFVQLARDPRYDELFGVDLCPDAIGRLRRRLNTCDVRVPKVGFRTGSMFDPAADMAGFDCAVLIETIEHVDPARLSALERALFQDMRPETVMITTPNAEFNTLLGVPAHRYRHPGHQFEWSRARFREWCDRVGRFYGYKARITDIAGCHPDLGGASQMAVFHGTGPASPPSAG